MYKCIKGFSLEKYDDNGFPIEGEYLPVEEGSIWYLPEDKDYRFVGGEIRLENDDLGWLEIPKEILEEHFQYLGKTVNEIMEEFKKLIIENPSLPVKIFAGENAWGGEYSYNEADINRVEISEITLHHDEYIDIDDFADRIYEEMEDDYDIKDELTKAIDKVVANTKFEKAICVYID